MVWAISRRNRMLDDPLTRVRVHCTPRDTSVAGRLRTPTRAASARSSRPGTRAAAPAGRSAGSADIALPTALEPRAQQIDAVGIRQPE